MFFSEKFSVKFLGKLKLKGFYNKLDLSNWMTNLLHLLVCKELMIYHTSQQNISVHLDVSGQPRQAVSALVEAVEDCVCVGDGACLTRLKYICIFLNIFSSLCTSSLSGSPLHQSRHAPGTPEVEQQCRWSEPEIEMCYSEKLHIFYRTKI